MWEKFEGSDRLGWGELGYLQDVLVKEGVESASLDGPLLTCEIIQAHAHNVLEHGDVFRVPLEEPILQRQDLFREL